ncbi:hypothetical protein JXA48_00180 [Candidatus Woesearchaeota archaeon]|nr:hypothetical protein [Candidatus Woesearchaeota archaeon]
MSVKTSKRTMRDFVSVKIGEETSFFNSAKVLGYDELVLCYSKSEEKKFTKEHKKQLVENSGLKLYFALCCVEKSLSVKNPLFDMLIGLGTILNSDFLGITHVLNNEFSKEKDAIHQRRSGLNHTILTTFREKNIEILVSLSDFNELDINEKAIVFGRMKQNAKACKQAKVTYSLVSMADSPKKMKSTKDMQSLRNQLEQRLN